uniref:Uncharacterized protein n=1 Tax=Vespula pensylvanica TaxID=30213 RepID=A0A834P956_VESPE|nr:hypothetical protein H0235_002175 [Vespula pensylvanica]
MKKTSLPKNDWIHRFRERPTGKLGNILWYVNVTRQAIGLFRLSKLFNLKPISGVSNKPNHKSELLIPEKRMVEDEEQEMEEEEVEEENEEDEEEERRIGGNGVSELAAS